MIARKCICAVALLWFGLCRTTAQELPSFLTPDHAPLLKIDGAPLALTEHRQDGVVDRYSYAAADGRQSLVIESLPCTSDTCGAIFDSNLHNTDRQASDNHGDFRTLTASEYHAAWKTDAAEKHVMVFRFPDSLQQWTYSLGLDAAPFADGNFSTLLALADRKRTETAQAAGEIELSRWSAQARAHAARLLADGHKPESLAVLKAVIVAAPTDYAAQMDFARNTDDKAAAQGSGAIIAADAESPELIAEGASLADKPGQVAVPFLGKGATGLQVILVPVEPGDARLLIEAAPVYQQITGIPVKVMRLEEPLYIGVPDRMPDRRAVRQLLVRLTGTADFTGWTLERYKNALKAAGESGSALERFQVGALLARLENGGGQFEAGPILEKFDALLASYRSSDRKTIYIGVTAADIGVEDANYVFSTGIETPAGPVNILSYHRMLAENAGDTFPSRKRLVARIAKQLVPPSLAALGIPRPADPADPYSFADGIARVDQKSLVLSEPTKDALAKILTPEKPAKAVKAEKPVKRKRRK